MNDINFLPPSYMRYRAKRRRVISEAMLLLGIGVVVIALSMVVRDATADLHREATVVEMKLEDARDAIAEVASLTTANRQMVRQLQVQRELVQPITQSQIIATLSQLLPEAVSITELRLAMHLPPPEPYRTKAEIKALDANRRTYAKSASAATHQAPRYVEITMTGVAAQEEHLADFLGAVSHHPVFAQARVHYSRTVEFLQLQGRDFRMSAQVQLDCEYQPRQEVANAN